jgi:tol-pal system protein YbgF
MKKATLICAALCGVVAFAAPAAAQNKREMQMMADIRMLQEQNQQLQVVLTQLTEALNASLKALTTRLDDQTNATRKSFADQSLKVDQFSSELRVVREGVAENNVKIGQLSQEVEALRLSIPQFPTPATGIDPAAPDAPLPGGAGVPATPPPPPVALGPGMAPQRLFETARADYYAGQWDLCVSGFETYLRQFARSELGHSAQFYIGECRYSDGKHREAVDAYDQVIANYPRSASVPTAYYKRGLALERLGQLDRARESFELVIKSFPDSDEARLAKQNLDRLNRGRPPQ